MKNWIYIASAFVAAAGIFGCTGKPAIETVMFEKKIQVPLTEGRTDSLTAQISVEMPIDAPGDMAAVITASLFGDKFAAAELQVAVDAYLDELTEEYINENTPLIPSDPEEIIMATNWGEYITGSFSDTYNNMVNYTIDLYTYRGGAHGMYSISALVFDLESGRRLTEEDLFVGASSKRLSELLEKYAVNAFEDPSEVEYLLVDTIEPNGNFTVSEEGVTYIYNPYEIAAYAVGVINITIPWEEVQDILK